jgi:hypothetical protein
VHATANLFNIACISLQDGESVDKIDYTFPENYAVVIFLGHRVSKKKNSGGFELKARWKGFTELEDTWDPIINQDVDNPALFQHYLKKISAEEAEPFKAASLRQP